MSYIEMLAVGAACGLFLYIAFAILFPEHLA